MSHIKARVNALQELVNELQNAKTIFERAALFAAIRSLAEDLEKDENLNGYARENAFSVRWHAAAALGFDETNSHSAESHHVWALGKMIALRSACK